MDDLIRFAWVLDGPGAGTALSADTIGAVLKEDTLGWVHLRADHGSAADWIAAQLDYLDPHVTTALTAEETRPRAQTLGRGLLLILRGVNLNEGEHPEDMVSVRVWADPNRIITLSRQRVRAVEDMSDAVQSGRGPVTASAFVALLVERLIARMEGFAGDLSDLGDDLEEQVVEAPAATLRRRVLETRLAAITARRHIAPQRQALDVLLHDGGVLLGASDLRRVEEAHDRLTRIMEDLDALRDRMVALREEIQNQLSDRLNRHMYLLSLISAVFLPLGFFTGLFGINVAGVPGTETPGAFWVFSSAMLVLGLILGLGMLYRLWRRM